MRMNSHKATASGLLLLVAVASLGTWGCQARPLQHFNRALLQSSTIASFPGGAVSQEGGQVHVAFPGGSYIGDNQGNTHTSVPGYADVTTQGSPSPGNATSPSPKPSNASSPASSPTPTTVNVAAPGTAVAVNSGRKLQQAAVTFPGGSINTDNGNVQVQYPGGSYIGDNQGNTHTSVPGFAEVTTQGSPSPGNATSPSPKPSNASISSTSPIPTTVNVAAPGTTVAVNSGRKMQQAAVTFPGGYVNTNNGNVQVQFPGGSYVGDNQGNTHTSVPGYADVTTQVSPSPSNATSPSPSPKPTTVNVAAPGTTVAVDAGRRL